MPPQPDITYSTDEDASEVTFSASTAKGEQWMGGPEKLCHSLRLKLTAPLPRQKT